MENWDFGHWLPRMSTLDIWFECPKETWFPDCSTEKGQQGGKLECEN